MTAATNAVDENNATPWIGGSYAQEWLLLDLGAVKAFNEVQVFPEFIRISMRNEKENTRPGIWEVKIF